MSFEKSNVRGVTSASWPNFPSGFWPSWPLTIPIHWLASSLCLLSTISWCVVGVLVQYGCHHIIQMDTTHWWCLRRFPSQCKALWVSRKVLFKCNIIIIITWAICDVCCLPVHISVFFIYMYIYIFSSFQSFWMYLIDWDFNLLYFSKVWDW